MSINIILIEFFVDNVKIDKRIRGTMPQFRDGHLSVAFRFLNFPPMIVNEEQDEPSCAEPVFRSGRSGLFSIPDEFPLLPDTFKIDIEVTLKMPPGCGCGDSVPVGCTSINITRDFMMILDEAKAFPERIPVTRTLRDGFLIANAHSKLVGTVGVFVRASCFGDMIVQRFTRRDEEEEECLAPCSGLPGRPVGPPCSQPPGGAGRGGGRGGGAGPKALPKGLLESLQDGIAKGFDANAAECQGENAAGGEPCPPGEAEGPPRRRHRSAGAPSDDAASFLDEDACPCAEDAAARGEAAGGVHPCGGTCGFKYDEIGAEINGSSLTIRVPRDAKPSKEGRALQGLVHKYGYVAPNPAPCTCASPDTCTCKGGAGGGRAFRGDGDHGAADARAPWGGVITLEDGQVRLCPPNRDIPVPEKRDPDYDNDIFALKIASKRDGDREPKRPKLELLLRTPKRTDETPRKCVDTQWLASDLPPGTKAAGKDKGKGKGKKGKKGKK